MRLRRLINAIWDHWPVHTTLYSTRPSQLALMVLRWSRRLLYSYLGSRCSRGTRRLLPVRFLLKLMVRGNRQLLRRRDRRLLFRIPLRIPYCSLPCRRRLLICFLPRSLGCVEYNRHRLDCQACRPSLRNRRRRRERCLDRPRIPRPLFMDSLSRLGRDFRWCLGRLTRYVGQRL